MTGTPVETLVARCLTDPSYLEGLKAGPAGMMPHPDLERLRLFSGFICKVQHNDLCDDLPGTRQLMHRYRIELGVFCDYRVVLAGRNGNKMRREEKIREFAGFLEDRIRTGRHPDCPGLLEVLRHERNLSGDSVGPRPGSRSCTRPQCRLRRVSQSILFGDPAESSPHPTRTWCTGRMTTL